MYKIEVFMHPNVESGIPGGGKVCIFTGYINDIKNAIINPSEKRIAIKDINGELFHVLGGENTLSLIAKPIRNKEELK